MLATIAGVREASAEWLGASATLRRAYLEGKGPFPERLPFILVALFLLSFPNHG